MAKLQTLKSKHRGGEILDEWKSYFIRGYEYEVNRDGVIRRASTGRILKPRSNHDGYWVVTMGPTKGRI